MVDVIGTLGRPPEAANHIRVDPPYLGYIRLLWLVMDAICAVLGDGAWALAIEARIYDPLWVWGIRRWVHWESEAQAMLRKYGFKSFTVDKVERWT